MQFHSYAGPVLGVPVFFGVYNLPPLPKLRDDRPVIKKGCNVILHYSLLSQCVCNSCLAENVRNVVKIGKNDCTIINTNKNFDVLQLWFLPETNVRKTAFPQYIYNCMTSLLTHNVAQSTRHSFGPKTNNQPIKKFLSLLFS